MAKTKAKSTKLTKITKPVNVTTVKVETAKSWSTFFSADFAFEALIAELLGSFALTFAILNTGGNAIVAAVALLIMYLVLYRLSGGHINPLTTISLLATRQIGWRRALVYLVAQFAGAMLAVVVASQFIAGSMTTDATTGAQVPAHLFSVTVSGTWKPFFAELVGSLIFGFGVASVFLTKREGYEAGFTMAGTLLLGLVLATSGSSALLNPAAALAVGALVTKTIWGFLAYAIAPIIGACIGALLYQLLQSGGRNMLRRS